MILNHKSKKFHLLLLITLLSSLLLASCKASNGTSIFGGDPVGTGTVGGTDGLEYLLNSAGTEYSVVGIGTCRSKSITIPSTHEGLPVTSIGRSAFMNSDITSVKISDGVEIIDDSAFSGCHALLKVTLPKSLVSIGSGAFFSCGSIDEILLPKHLGKLGSGAFKACVALSSVEIEEESELSLIPASCFEECTALERVTVRTESRITKICERAFYGCKRLESLSFEGKNSLGSVDEYAFFDCRSLKDLDFLKDSEVSVINDHAFSGCSSISSLILPDTCELLMNRVFSECTSLRSIYIPKSLKIANAYNFIGCSLDSITVDPDNPTFAQDGNCLLSKDKTTLYLGTSNAVIPDTTLTISSYAFYGCDKLTQIIIPPSVREIGHSAFEGCASLKEIELPDSVTALGDRAFALCTSLAYIRIGSGLESAFPDAFQRLISLQKIEVSEKNLRFFSKGNCLTFKDGSDITLLRGTPTSVIPDGVTVIERYAFGSLATLEKIHIPSSVKVISQYAFDGCTSLKTVTFEDGCALEMIEANAFSECGITEINLPKNAIVGLGAFSRCSALKTIWIHAFSPELSEISFDMYCTSLKTVYFGGTVAEWKSIKDNSYIYYVPLSGNAPTGTAWYSGCPNVTVVCSDGSVTYK